ncbi:MAG: sulfatase, partial [bacterium]|nr:sulfatase [bacterium]
MNRGNKRLVFVIIMDATRPDHLSLFGSKRDTTPNLVRHLSNSLIFRNAYSTTSWTPGAHASIISGLYLHQHGCYGDSFDLKPGIQYLPKILTEQGYATLGISLTPYLSEQTGYKKMFTHFIELWKKRPTWGIISDFKSKLYNICNGSDNKVFESVLLMKKWLKMTSDQNNRFIFINLITAHNPYKAPGKWKKLFLDSKIKNYDEDRVKHLSDSGGYEFLSGKISATEEDWEMVKTFYDQEIAYMDFRLGEFFEFLKNENLFDSSEIFLTADHGEAFGKHDLAYHTFGLYEDLIKIPLIYKPSNFRDGINVEKPVSLIDIFTTILQDTDYKQNSMYQTFDLKKYSEIPEERIRFFEFGRPKSIL